jgi:hypothetical protein
MPTVIKIQTATTFLFKFLFTNNSDLLKVSDHLNYGWPLVTHSGLEQISYKTNRPLTPRRAGRPKLIKPI